MTDVRTNDNIACPHCGGAIRAAAKVCKHCKRSLVAPAPIEVEWRHRAPGGPSSPGPSAAPAGADEFLASAAAASSEGWQRRARRAAVLHDLQNFLATRRVAPTATLGTYIQSAQGADATEILGHLASAGIITPMQVDALREGFRSEQVARLGSILHAVTSRGLVTPPHAQAALTAFEGLALEVEPGGYLVEQGLLTLAQLSEFRGDPGRPADLQPPGALVAFTQDPRVPAVGSTTRDGGGAWERVLSATGSYCERFVAEIAGRDARRIALAGGLLLLATIFVPRGSSEGGLQTAFDLVARFDLAWITTIFPPVAGLFLVVAAMLSQRPGVWLTYACAFTGFVPTLVSLYRQHAEGFGDLAQGLGSMASVVATAICIELIRRRDAPLNPWARTLLVASGAVLSLGAFAAMMGPGDLTRDDMFPASIAIAVERLARMAIGWLSLEVALRKPPTLLLAWSLVVVTIANTLLFQVLVVATALLSGHLTFWLPVNAWLLTVIQVVEFVAGVAAVGYLVLREAWGLHDGSK